jgi:hypothetical protein
MRDVHYLLAALQIEQGIEKTYKELLVGWRPKKFLEGKIRIEIYKTFV